MELDAHGRVAPGVALASDGHVGTRLQDIVEEASVVFGRPAGIDDRHLRLLAYTEQTPGSVDDVRLQSVMKRPFSDDLLAWFRDHGLGSEVHAFVIPGNAELGLVRRVCAPIRFRDHLLGYLWLTDRDSTVDERELPRLDQFADEAALVLYRELLLRDLDRRHERELLRTLLSGDDEARSEAVSQLAEFGLFTATGAVAALVAPLPPTDEEESSEAVRVAVDAALVRARRRLAPQHGIHLLRSDHAVLVVATADPGVRSSGVAAFAERVRQELRDALPARSRRERVVVAVGGAAPRLRDAPVSYRQARTAARTTAAMPTLGDVVRWDDLGIFRMLAELRFDELAPSALHPGLASMLGDARQHFLVQTLECYLDHAGDSQATAAALFLHRTTLYHRLRRIERTAGIDLAVGDDRLAMHLGLKLARLHGMSWDDAGPADGAEADAQG